MSRLANAALTYARMGLQVFPCSPRSKAPLPKSHGLYDATSDPEAVASTWEQNSRYNIGLRTGIELQGKRLYVLDIDPRNGGEQTLAPLLAQYGPLPATATVITGRGDGGRHYYFLAPADVTLRSKLGLGADLQGGGKYVVAPPSIHPDTGKSYEWAEDGDLVAGAQVADLPAWVLEMFAKDSSSKEREVATNASAGRSDFQVSLEQVQDLRSALLSMRSDDWELWVRIGLALKKLGNTGRALWMEWSSQSAKFDAAVAAAKWDDFEPEDIHLESVFFEAARLGWINPRKGQQVACNSVEFVPPVEVDFLDVFEAAPPAPEFIISELVPAGVVTLLGANGGTGKSTLALMAAACVAAGLPFLGKPTKRARVLFYSAEDAAGHLRHRLNKICSHLMLGPTELAESLILWDATDTDAALFSEVSIRGIKSGVVTPSYKHLAQYVGEREINLLIIDNASDTFDASEIERARVRAFIRSLAQLVKQRSGGVILLAHVDKNSARGLNSSQGYSGSTAWNNSVRSRLFMSETKMGELLLEHQKSNFGPKADPLTLAWRDGVLDLAASEDANGGTLGQAPVDRLSAVLSLFADFYARGEWIATAHNSPSNPYKMLHREESYPARLDKHGLASLVRDAERDALLMREVYTTEGRKLRQRWAVTEAGKQLIAPSAPCGPCP